MVLAVNQVTEKSDVQTEHIVGMLNVDVANYRADEVIKKIFLNAMLAYELIKDKSKKNLISQF